MDGSGVNEVGQWRTLVQRVLVAATLPELVRQNGGRRRRTGASEGPVGDPTRARVGQFPPAASAISTRLLQNTDNVSGCVPRTRIPSRVKEDLPCVAFVP